MKAIHTKDAPEAIGPYSQGIVVNNLFFSSGQIPLTATGELMDGGIEEQAEQVFKNIIAVLKEAGSSLESVIKTTVFLQNMDDFGKVNEVYGSYFHSHKPARSCIEVSRLPKDVLIEIEVVALIK